MPSLNVAPDKQCHARSKSTGERCGKVAIAGLRTCERHGSGTRAARDKSAEIRERANVEAQLKRFVTPIDRDDPEANPIAAFEIEFLRTLGRIRWLDNEIQRLDDVRSLTFGLTKVEDVNATEYAGRNTTYEARSNVLLELQWRERQHLLALEKVWISARLDERKIAVKQAEVEIMQRAIYNILTALGHNMADGDVTSVVHRHLAAIETTGVAS